MIPYFLALISPLLQIVILVLLREGLNAYEKEYFC